MSAKNKAVFIDRDGVINEERNYVHRIDDFVLLAGVLDGLKLLNGAGYRLIVVTNQAGIARGYYSQKEMDILHEHLHKNLALHGVTLDAIYFCPHHPQGEVKSFAIDCNCRKPAPGMILQAAREFDLDLAKSVLIGDKLSDVQAGKNAGVGKTVLVKSGHNLEPSAILEADLVAADLLDAARILTKNSLSR